MDTLIIEEKQNNDINDTLCEAKKYIGLMEAFEIEAGNMEEQLIENKNELAELAEENRSVSIENTLTADSSMIVEEDMVNDFSLVRRVLRNTLEKIDLIIDKFGKDMATSNSEDISAAFITSFSELVKSSNDTAKNLTDMYGKAAKTQLDVKKLLSEIKDMDEKEGNSEDSNVTNIVNFVGSPAELLASLKGK